MYYNNFNYKVYLFKILIWNIYKTYFTSKYKIKKKIIKKKTQITLNKKSTNFILNINQQM